MFIRRGTDYNTVVNLTTCVMRRAVCARQRQTTRAAIDPRAPWSKVRAYVMRTNPQCQVIVALGRPQEIMLGSGPPNRGTYNTVPGYQGNIPRVARSHFPGHEFNWDLPTEWPIEEGTALLGALLDPFCCVVCVSSDVLRAATKRFAIICGARHDRQQNGSVALGIDQMPERLCRLRAEAAASVKLVWLLNMCNTLYESGRVFAHPPDPK